MEKSDARAIAREFRAVYKLLDDQDRRMASMLLSGKVAEVNGDLVRLEIQPEDGRTGKPFLSPWVQVQEAAGQSGTHFPVRKGDPMRLMSPNGEIGPQSLAIRDGYTKDAGNPTDKSQKELVIANDGPVRIKGTSLVFEAQDIDNQSVTLTHNKVNVGETHTHTEVKSGSEISGPPQS